MARTRPRTWRPTAARSRSALSVQLVSTKDSSVTNHADGSDAVALQNIASNADDVRIDSTSVQAALIKQSSVNNYAQSDSYASQSLASNANNVRINSGSLQVALVKNSGVYNTAKRHGNAIQNVASNNGE